MSHDITNPAEAIYANRPAWHRLGTTFKPGEGEGMLTADVERLAPSIFAERSLLPLGGFTAPVDLSDPFAMLTPSTILSGGDYRMIARTDGADSKVHGIAKKGYRIWQVREAFAFLDSLVSEGSLQYESVFALNGGDHVILVCRLPGAFTLGRRDTTVQYVMVKVTFTGQDSIVMIPTYVRVVCANTVAMAERAARGKMKDGQPVIFRLRHTAGLTDRLDSARVHLAQFDSALQSEAHAAELLASKSINRTEAEAFLAEMFPTKDADGAPLKGKTATERERKVSIMREAWKVENATFASIGDASLQGSAWHLLQSVTRAVDHGGLLRVRGSERKREESGFLSMTQGTGASLKVKARETLLALA
jgi:phage/plasmid-like protein (TIGR03299 family)